MRFKKIIRVIIAPGSGLPTPTVGGFRRGAVHRVPHQQNHSLHLNVKLHYGVCHFNLNEFMW